MGQFLNENLDLKVLPVETVTFQIELLLGKPFRGFPGNFNFSQYQQHGFAEYKIQTRVKIFFCF